MRFIVWDFAEQAETFRKEVASACTRADYLPLLKWMQDKVHATGSTLLPQDLMESVTGERTNPEHYLAHLQTRFC